MAKILVLHGPNLNLLGTREPDIYGAVTLDQINHRLAKLCQSLGHDFGALQSNDEAALVNRVQQAGGDNTDFVIINPAAFTHTSVALRDALLATSLPFIEIHISNVHARESFRQQSYFSDIAVGVICGVGNYGYDLAILAADHQLQSSNNKES